MDPRFFRQYSDMITEAEKTREDLADVGNVVGQAARTVWDAPGKFVNGVKQGWAGNANTAGNSGADTAGAAGKTQPPVRPPQQGSPVAPAPDPGMKQKRPDATGPTPFNTGPTGQLQGPMIEFPPSTMLKPEGPYANDQGEKPSADTADHYQQPMMKYDAPEKHYQQPMKEGELLRSFADMLSEAEVISELGAGATTPVPATGYSRPNRPAGMPGDGPQTSTVGVHPGDKNRVTVAPNVQKSVLDYERQKAYVDDTNSKMVDLRSPQANSLGRDISRAIGNNVVGPIKSFVHGLGQGYDDSDAGRALPDPPRPVDVIPNPPKGTTNPRESANDQLRKLSDIIAEAEQFKGATNQGKRTKDMMKPYKG